MCWIKWEWNQLYRSSSMSQNPLLQKRLIMARMGKVSQKLNLVVTTLWHPGATSWMDLSTLQYGEQALCRSQ